MRKFAIASTALLVSFALVSGEEYRAVIKKVDGKNVTFQKMKKSDDGKFEKDGDEVTLPVASDLKVFKGKFNKEAKKLEAGDPLEGGLENKAFKNEKGAFGRVTTDPDNKSITSIIIVDFGDFKKKKKDDVE